MSLNALRDQRWINLLRLRDEQNQAIQSAIYYAESNERISELLEMDMNQLIHGSARMISEEDGRKKLYGERLYRLHPVLVLLMRLPWLINQYAERNIPDEILVNTLSDVRIWMDVCLKKTGCHGLLEYGWLTNHFSFKLFRLGRLQFIAQPGTTPTYVYRHLKSKSVLALCPDGARYTITGDGAGVNGKNCSDDWTATLKIEQDCATGHPIHRSGYAKKTKVELDLNEWRLTYQPGDLVLDMHIAEGMPLDPDSVKKSIEYAPEFFEKHLGITGVKALTCSSWLLDDHIAQLQPDGNIACFQRHFQLVPHADSSDWQMKQRAFGDPDIDVRTAECRTSLQRAIQAWYNAGGYCRHAAGLILL